MFNYKKKIFEIIYLIYSIYPIYIIINYFRYFGKDISLHSFVFTKKIGKKVKIHGGVFIDINSSVDEGSYIGGDQLGITGSKILYTKIGKYCSISQNLVTLPFGHNYLNISTYPFKHSKNLKNVFNTAKTVTTNQIVIEDGVWIGSNVIILGRVTLHEGSVIGAGSIVTKDVPPYSIAVGNPARVIKKRFSMDNINKLLKMNIYLNLERINVNDLIKQDIKNFINKYSKLN